MKNRYFLKLSYQGTHYHGWQIQPHQKTVQETLNTHISVLLGEKINCVGVGRTDSRVHAENYMCHFDTTQKLTSSFVQKLDRFLPIDIHIQQLYFNPDKIHARFNALSRSYKYLITKNKDPFSINLATRNYLSFDIDLLNQCARIVLNHNDFESFSKSNNSHKNYLCKIYSAAWSEDERFYKFEITASRFLRGMVRMMVGTMLDVGRKKISPEEFEQIILARDRQKAGKALPPDGLYFTGATFPEGKLIPVED